MTLLQIIFCIVMGICAGLALFVLALCLLKALRREKANAVCVCRCDAEPYPHDHAPDCPPCPNEWCSMRHYVKPAPCVSGLRTGGKCSFGGPDKCLFGCCRECHPHCWQEVKP